MVLSRGVGRLSVRSPRFPSLPPAAGPWPAQQASRSQVSYLWTARPHRPVGISGSTHIWQELQPCAICTNHTTDSSVMKSVICHPPVKQCPARVSRNAMSSTCPSFCPAHPLWWTPMCLPRPSILPSLSLRKEESWEHRVWQLTKKSK